MLWLGLGESSCLLVDSQRVVPEMLIKHGYDFKFSNLKAALNNLLIKQ
jgi:NAD dependent epimerase/dehydratase family enzyme